MERDLTPRVDRTAPPDDAELGALVRAAAEDWHRPPQRLDQPTWRERVEVGRRASRGTPRRWFGRIAEAGVLAVAATVVLAVAAVFLTSPGRNGVASNPSTQPTEAASPTGLGGTPSAAPATSPLPALYVNGQLPSVTNVLLQVNGSYRQADLAKGTLGSELSWGANGWDGNGGSTVLARPGGGWVCICSDYTAGKGGRGSDELIITLEAVDATGTSNGRAAVRTLLSGIDPSQPLSSDSTSVNVVASASPDGRFGLIGWSERSAAGWQAGVDVVDLASLQVVDRVTLPMLDLPAAADGRTWVRLAPWVDLVDGVDVALVTENWFVEDGTTANPLQGTTHWSASFADGSMGDPASAGTRLDETCYEWEHGLIDASSFYVACIRNGSGRVTVERHRLDGSEIDRTDVGQFTGYGAFAARPDHRLFMWDPQSHTLTSYDLQTGATHSVKAPDTAGLTGPLEVAAAVGRAVGSWIAPSATAKILLQPAMIVSPDGTRLYAIGIEATAAELGGSAGVFAFDISGDEPVLTGHWPPNADYISVASSADGAFVYVAGAAGADTAGVQSPDVQSSITVFDTTDGSIRLIVGELGTENQVLFSGPIVR